MQLKYLLLPYIVFTILVCGCAGLQPAPQDPNNICNIFLEKRKWYTNAYASYREWGTPIPVLMAIMYQESRFNAKAKPPRTTCLFIFPGPRPSSAFGYSQALDETWAKYKQHTGNSGADRDSFADSIDFIGWYCNLSYTRCGIAKNDANNLYLAYHEGQGGFLKKTYQKKTWLKQVALRVQKQAEMYSKQLASCEHKFRKHKCCLWPF